MKTYIAMYSADAKYYHLVAKDKDDAYRIFGRVILGMEGTDDPDFDTGNVDIDLVELGKLKRGCVVEILGD